MNIILYHNPKCNSSRTVLALIRAAGHEPTIIEYLKTPPDSATLLNLAKTAGLPLHALLRQKETPYHELGLGNPNITEAQILAALAQHPILLNRPIVVTYLGTKLCRPPELVNTLLPPAS